MTKPEYVEISFGMPFLELYYGEKWGINDIEKHPILLLKLCNKMDIEIDTNQLHDLFLSTELIVVLFAKSNKEVFITFDFKKDPTDQMGFCSIGIRYKTADVKHIEKELEMIYFNSAVRSGLLYDYFTEDLYNIVTKKPYYSKREIQYINQKN
jgi:hypothetical protein